MVMVTLREGRNWKNVGVTAKVKGQRKKGIVKLALLGLIYQSQVQRQPRELTLHKEVDNYVRPWVIKPSQG